MNPIDYKGFVIAESSGGGKAGKGCNKTATIQVREPGSNGDYFLKTQIRFEAWSPLQRAAAIKKAREFIDNLHSERFL